MPRKTTQKSRQLNHLREPFALHVETQAAGMLLALLGVVPMANRRAQAIHRLERQAESLNYLAQRRLAAITDHLGDHSCTLASPARVHILDHFLATLVLEVDVDIGRL